MALVGRAVKKAFEGYGIFSGIVHSYDPESGFYKIIYEDGDSEEMEHEELALILGGSMENCNQDLVREKKRGRKPKKRHRMGENLKNVECSGNFVDTHIEYCDFGETRMNMGKFDVSINGNISVGVVDGTLIDDFSIQSCDVNLENESRAVVEEIIAKVPTSYLNLDGNDSARVFEQPGNTSHDRSYSVAVMAESGTEGISTAGHLGKKDVIGIFEENQMNDTTFRNNFKEHDGDGFSEVKEETPSKVGDSATSEKKNTPLGIIEKAEPSSDFGELMQENVPCIQGKVVDEGNQVDRSSLENDLKEAAPTLRLTETPKAENGSVTFYKEAQEWNKRRKLSEKVDPTPQTPLRRSTRRATAKMADSLNTTWAPDGSTTVIPKSDEKFCSLDQQVTGERTLSPTLALPASSNDLNIDELPVLDLFSVYTCLRSFSTLLFLSPFSLDALIAALKCSVANSLMDSIHLSILQVLKLHLEFLSGEGFQSASDCLRNLNWTFLDSITWPVYLLEYLMVCPSGFKMNLERSYLKLLNGDYYKQSAQVKLEILRCLCDDVIGTEVIRSELDRRNSATQVDTMDIDGIGDSHFRRKDSVDDFGSSGLTDEVAEEVDPNNDECCLCKMDGSLICCDGCPAAYHLRCVGMAKVLLPEGDWYCLECEMKKHDGWMKTLNPVRGADLLGVDPYGRAYFGSFGYLLVSDTCETEASCQYYNKQDVLSVIEVLKLDASYSGIVTAISTYWDVGRESTEVKDQCDTGIHFDTNLDMDVKSFDAPTQAFDESKPVDTYCQSEDYGLQDGIVAMSQCVEVTLSFASSEVSSKSGASSPGTKNIEKVALTSEKIPPITSDPGFAQENPSRTPRDEHGQLVVKLKKEGFYQKQSQPISYTNYYSFGQMAYSVAEEFTRKTTDSIKDPSKKSDEEIISQQLKIISKKSSMFCWFSIHKLHEDAKKERCGWCFSCRTSADQNCLFNTGDNKGTEVSNDEVFGIRTKRNTKAHLSAIIYHIVSIEDRLRGLLCGPWENPKYSKLWRKSILKSSSVASVKSLLLVLESNLRRVALSAEWLKQVDSAVTVGSALHVLTSSMNVSTKNWGARKRARKNMHQGEESMFVSHVAAKSGIHWWRGGRLARQLFSWKMLPQSLALLAARQGGCRKIPGIFYPDGSDFARRSKCVAWRASVEMSTSVAQLAYQVRDLDSNIRWSDLLNTDLFPKLSKESRKITRPLKNITIRKKWVEGTQVKYLLDFGKRKIVPEIVIRYGSLHDESSTRTKYWLTECYVPLNLLKAFEERKLARKFSKKDKSDKMNFGLLSNMGGNQKKVSRCKGLSYLLSKGQSVEIDRSRVELLADGSKRKRSTRLKGVSTLRSGREKYENHQCGHCCKDVSIRDALKCRSCKGFFHKRHIKASKSAITAKYTYTCFKCQKKKHVKIKTMTQKVNQRSEKSKISTKKPLPKKRISKRMKDKKLDHGESANRPQSSNKIKPKNVSEDAMQWITWHKGKRTRTAHPYWVNGIYWGRKSNDERALCFREKKVLLRFGQLAMKTSLEPICSLCHEAYDSGLIYIACEKCEDWFHGDAFGIAAHNVDNIIGFSCHTCCARSRPTCPLSKLVMIERTKSCEERSNDEGSNHVIGQSNDKLTNELLETQVLPSNQSWEETNCLHPIADSGQILESEKLEEKLDEPCIV
ncbi:DDT domain-containing protein PTM-like [Aristolochia californica]|uniref:DDT domain-containing protein PTM-like n=1 Tax=Aristolochia californica TaxID=171875 RepID=UPI0035DA5BB3